MIISILKIVGIVLLVILLLLIFILSILLFVPIRYRFDGSYNEKADLDVSVKWMPVFLNAVLTYKEDKLLYIVKLYGGVILTNQEGLLLSWIGRKIQSSTSKKEKEDLVKSDDTATDTGSDLPVTINKTEVEDNEESIKQRKRKKSIITRIQEKIQSIIQKIKNLIQKIKKINEKKDALIKVYHHKRFEIAKNDVIRYIKELWRGIKPKKLEGRIHFGLEDPATTGQILGVLSMFLVWYYDNITIVPDFEKACFDGNLSFYGKVRLFTLFKIIIKIIFNKNLIKVVKKVQTIIES